MAADFRAQMTSRKTARQERRNQKNKKTCKKARGPPTPPTPTPVKRQRSRTTHTPDESNNDQTPNKRSRGARVNNAETAPVPEPQPSPTPSEKNVFKYPIGTKIARDFGDDGVFEGEITSLYKDDANLCQVIYTDGDDEDMEADEIEYGIQLYNLKKKLNKNEWVLV